MSNTKARIFLLFKAVTISLEWVQSILPEEKELYEIVTALHKRNILPNGIFIFISFGINAISVYYLFFIV